MYWTDNEKTDSEETDSEDDDENDDVDSEDETGNESGEWIVYKSMWYSTVHFVAVDDEEICNRKTIYMELFTIQGLLEVFVHQTSCSGMLKKVNKLYIYQKMVAKTKILQLTKTPSKSFSSE